MTAFISASTSLDGVIAYQDHADKNQFYYVPQSIDLVLGENLKRFKVDYWGIGGRYIVSDGDNYNSRLGAILSGSAKCDISSDQKTRLTDQIKRQFQVDNPRLSPIRISSVKVQPVYAKNTLDIVKGDVVFPENLQFGQEFEYLLGTGNSLFAEFAASVQRDPGVVSNPAFGLNITAEAEFRGEPWICEIDANASQVWKYVREHVNVGVNYGWFKLASADYLNIVRNLDRAKDVSLKMQAGSLDLEKYGSQIFEMGKQIFQSINTDGGGRFFQI